MNETLVAALKTLILTPATVEFLEYTDPQALKQAREAVKEADGTDCEGLATIAINRELIRRREQKSGDFLQPQKEFPAFIAYLITEYLKTH